MSVPIMVFVSPQTGKQAQAMRKFLLVLVLALIIVYLSVVASCSVPEVETSNTTRTTITSTIPSSAQLAEHVHYKLWEGGAITLYPVALDQIYNQLVDCGRITGQGLGEGGDTLVPAPTSDCLQTRLINWPGMPVQVTTLVANSSLGADEMFAMAVRNEQQCMLRGLLVDGVRVRICH